MKEYDLLVIGGGPGGYSTAINAAKNGLKVAVFEKATVGGTCLNVGCIPTKFLVDKANAMEKVRALESSLIFRDTGLFSFSRIMKGKAEVVKKLTGGVAFLFKKNKVDLISGEAVLEKDRVVNCAGESYRGKNVIIATGSVPSVIPVPGKELCIDSTGALELDKCPRRMVIIGGGVIGLELACAFRSFGSEITVVEMLPEILPREQREAVKIVLNAMKKKGINVCTGAKLLRIEKSGESLKAFYEMDGKEVSTECDKVLMAAGRRSNFAGIDAAKLGLELLNNRFIKVDSHQKTNLPGVYAIGDVSGGIQLAHAAYAEGEIALADILGKKVPEKQLIPSCVYTIPCFASVGLNMESAKAAGYEPVMGTFDYSANGMALAEGANGQVFVFADRKTGVTLGVTAVGENASEMIAFATAAVTGKYTTEDWEKTVVAHPSLCEMIKEAALDAFGKAVHK